MEDFMSENNSGANIQQNDNRNNEQNKDKRQKFDPAKQDARKYNNNRNNNRRRRNNGGRQGGYDNKRRDNAEISADGKNQGRQPQQNNKFKREQNQGGEKRNQQTGERKPKNKRPREFGSAEEVAKNVKKVETIDDIRSDNARITKEIYLEIASLKNINLN